MLFDTPSFVGAPPSARLDFDGWYNAEAIAPRAALLHVFD
jgi:hypothetical protein